VAHLADGGGRQLLRTESIDYLKNVKTERISRVYLKRLTSGLSALALAALWGCGASATSTAAPQALPPAAQAKSDSISFTYTRLHARGNGPIAFGPAGRIYVDLTSLCDYGSSIYLPCAHSIARISASGQQSTIRGIWCSGKGPQRSCAVAAALLAPSDGSLWIVRDDGALLRVPPGRFSASAMQLLPSAYGYAQAIAADAGGHVWVASWNKKRRFELLATTVHDPQVSTRVALPACSTNGGGPIALAYISGTLYVLEGGALWTVASTGSASCIKVPTNFAPSSGIAQLGNALILGYSGGGLYSITNGNVTIIPAPQQYGSIIAPLSIAVSNGSAYFTFSTTDDPHVNPQQTAIGVYSNGSFSYVNLGHAVGSLVTSPAGTLYISAACAMGCLGRASGS
jgi:hypothetical protein